MSITTAREYLQRIADWQAESGRSGAPPVAFDKKLSNWIQFCRTVGRRGKLNEAIAEAFGLLGIAIERGPTDANATSSASYADPRGFIPVLRAAAAHIDEKHEAPSLRSSNVLVRHEAAWLIRLQAGILPANSFGWTAPMDDQIVPERVLQAVGEVQTSREMVAEWLLWCARAQCALDRRAPGNNWQETTYVCSHKTLIHRYPDLVAVSEKVRFGIPVPRADIPDPAHLRATLSCHTSAVMDKVKRVSLDRDSIYDHPLDLAIDEVAPRKKPH